MCLASNFILCEYVNLFFLSRISPPKIVGKHNSSIFSVRCQGTGYLFCPGARILIFLEIFSFLSIIRISSFDSKESDSSESDLFSISVNDVLVKFVLVSHVSFFFFQQ